MAGIRAIDVGILGLPWNTVICGNEENQSNETIDMWCGGMYDVIGELFDCITK